MLCPRNNRIFETYCIYILDTVELCTLSSILIKELMLHSLHLLLVYFVILFHWPGNFLNGLYWIVLEAPYE